MVPLLATAAGLLLGGSATVLVRRRGTRSEVQAQA